MFEIGPFWKINFFLITTLSISSLYLLFNIPKDINFSILKKNINFYDNKIENKIESLTLNSILEKDIFKAIPLIPEEELIYSFEPYKALKILQIPSIPNELEIIENYEQERDFLPPLQLNLKGTIISSNLKNNFAFIENIRSKEEKSYFIGDVIEDSQLIFIGKNKVVLIRSNGQQENLYINKNSENEEEIISRIPWKSIISIKENNIEIDATLLSKRVLSIGEFLDELDIVTFYENGNAIGCQIGNDSITSLVNALNLKSGDIILSIDNISTAYAESRVEIYKKLITEDYENSKNINVLILRDGKEILYKYNIFKSSEESFRKSIGILALSNSVINPTRSSNFDKLKIEKQIQKGHDVIGNLSLNFEKDEKKLIKKAGKKNVIER